MSKSVKTGRIYSSQNASSGRARKILWVLGLLFFTNYGFNSVAHKVRNEAAKHRYFIRMFAKRAETFSRLSFTFPTTNNG